ncbi:hypothetical protein J6590_108404 [Homalodisca vitripennis]|nr:hypothetical protein J6590_108404 [Homalodisca vitripennis]
MTDNTQSDINTFFNLESNQGGFNIIYTNIRSMRKNFDSFIININNSINRINIIILSEIWIGTDEVELFNIPGYVLFAECNDVYRSGGVLCYVDNSFDCNQLQLNMTTADALLLNVRFNRSYFKLLCLYRLHNFSENLFLDEISNVLSNINNNVIFVGDININIAATSAVSNNYSTLLYNNGFVSLINDPTRITNISKTCIDHVFVRSRNISKYKSAVFDEGITDHCILGISFRNNDNINLINNKISPNKSIIDFNLVKNKLQSTSWEEVYSERDVNLCYRKFHDLLIKIVDSCSKTFNSCHKLLKAKSLSPWINQQILNKFKKRKKLFKICKRRPYDNVLKNYFNKFCSDLSTQVSFTKNNFYARKIESCSGNVSQQWKVINSLTGVTSNKNVERIELPDGTFTAEPSVIADEINKYLISVQSDRPCTVPTVTFPLVRSYLQSFFIEPTDLNEIIHAVKNLKNKKSTGFDKISVELLKFIIDEIAPILVYLINISFSTGIFPEMLKLSSVVPILKKNNSFQLDNIRPISLLSVFSKLFEKIMVKRLLKYLDNLNFFSKRQFGFVKGKSTEDALTYITENIYSSLNSRLKCTGLFIDFKKAFDLVDHEILLNKLEYAGIRGIAWSWFRTLITNRKQQVKIQNTFSSTRTVESGVPQGSVISAVLFLIFINDLLTLNFNGKITAFADDIAIFYSHENELTISEQINSDLLLLRKWCLINKMQVNVNKSKFLNFSFQNFELPVPVKFHSASCNMILCNCQPLEKVNTFKYLGITLDKKFTFEEHISILHKKITSTIRKFYFLRNFCSIELLRSLYFALINSRLQYGILCWGGTYNFLINRLRTTQNYFLRIILKKAKRESSFPLYSQLKILPIQHLFIFKVLRLFFVRSGNLGTNNLYYATRFAHNRNYRLPKVNKTIFKHSITYLGPKYFNFLPLDIKNAANLKTFCKK